MFKKGVICLFLSLAWCGVSCAQEEIAPELNANPSVDENAAPMAEVEEDFYKDAFKIVYSGKDKGPALNQVKVKGQIFKNNMPLKHFEAKTNEDGKFLLDQDYGSDIALDLFYIEGQEKLNKKCAGNAVPGKKELQTSCRKST